MAKIILKSPYLKPGANPGRGGYVRYVATRAGVEMPNDSKLLFPAAKRQSQTVASLIKDYPDLAELYEYEDYQKAGNRANALDFIARAAETHPELIDGREGYARYIATRPGAEMLSLHGLFTDAGAPAILERAAEEVSAHGGNVWCHIVSLRREDAERLGYNDAASWQNLLRGQRNVIAKAMKIRPENFRWYAAFHNESHHPHIHMIAFSKDPSEAWLSRQGIMEIKSALARQIFKQDMLCVYDKQTVHRDDLRSEGKERIAEIISDINKGTYRGPAVSEMLTDLSKRLKNTSGKKVYGYLAADTKLLIDNIVDELAKDERIGNLYDLWYGQREQIIRTYTDKLPERIPLSRNKEFKPIKNAVIHEALNLYANAVTFDDPEDITSAPDDWMSGAYLVAYENDAGYGKNTHQKNKTENEFTLYKKAKKLLDENSDKYDPKEAIRLLYRSASMGYEWAQYRLGKIFLTGDITRQIIPYGLKWLWAAESRYNHCAQTLLGRSFLHGIYTKQDYSKAEELLTKAAIQDDAIAAYSLATMHLDGIAKVSSEAAAVSLLGVSANGGYEWGQYLYGKILMQGELTQKDIRSAEKYLKDAATPQQKPWHPDDMIPLGNKYAQYLLGKLYLLDEDVPMNPSEAVKWLTASADQGYEWAQYQLGKMRLFGEYTDRDPNEGIMLLSAAANQGNIYAKMILDSYAANKNAMARSAALGAFRLLGRLAAIIEDRLRENSGSPGHTDRKLWREINKKKQAQGLRM